MMPYITQNSLKGRIPEDTLIESLDDNNDGIIDDDVWLIVQADADNQVDSILGQRFSVPFTAPVPALVIEAARVFTLELLYLRRGRHTTDDNPWLSKAERLRSKLTMIANGDEPLEPNKRGKGRIRIVSEPSRTQSSSGNLST